MSRKNKTKEYREKELRRLVEFKTKNPTDADFTEARSNMASFYRLCGLAKTNLYLSNDVHWANRESTHKSEEREYQWYKRLDKIFSDTYGLRLVYCGYMPSIGVFVGENGGFAEKISRFFY